MYNIQDINKTHSVKKKIVKLPPYLKETMRQFALNTGYHDTCNTNNNYEQGKLSQTRTHNL